MTTPSCRGSASSLPLRRRAMFECERYRGRPGMIRARSQTDRRAPRTATTRSYRPRVQYMSFPVTPNFPAASLKASMPQSSNLKARPERSETGLFAFWSFFECRSAKRAATAAPSDGTSSTTGPNYRASRNNTRCPSHRRQKTGGHGGSGHGGSGHLGRSAPRGK